MSTARYLLQEAFEGVTEILQEVKTVGDLRCSRCAPRGTVRIEVAAVAGDEGNGRTRLEPCRDGIGGAVG